MQRTHRGVALDTVFDENGTRRGSIDSVDKQDTILNAQ